MRSVTGEQVDDPRRGGEPATAAVALGGVGEVAVQHRAPGVVETAVDHVEHRPAQPRRRPLVVVGIHTAAGGQDVGDETGGVGELDVGGDTVGVDRAQAQGEALHDPPLDTLRGHGDDLRGERIGQRRRKQVGQTVGERGGAGGGVHGQHRYSPS